MKYLVSAVNTIRVETVEEVERLHAELKEDPRFTLKKFEYQHKEVKAKGEVIDEYFKVTLTKVFTDIKEPDAIASVIYEVE